MYHLETAHLFMPAFYMNNICMRGSLSKSGPIITSNRHHYSGIGAAEDSNKTVEELIIRKVAGWEKSLDKSQQTMWPQLTSEHLQLTVSGFNLCFSYCQQIPHLGVYPKPGVDLSSVLRACEVCIAVILGRNGQAEKKKGDSSQPLSVIPAVRKDCLSYTTPCRGNVE